MNAVTRRIKLELLGVLAKSFNKVLIEKVIQRDGKMVTEHYWVSPDEVGHKDKVVYNRHLLSDAHPQRHSHENDVSNPHEFTTEEEAEQILGMDSGALERWFEHRTVGESKSIEMYTGGPCKAINSYLRGIFKIEDAKTNKDPYWNVKMLKAVTTTIQQLDKAISRYETPIPIRVHRIVNKNMLSKFQDALNSDGIFVEDGYCSTSILQGSFGDEEVDVNLVIDVPAGKGIGMYVDPVSEYPGEYEYLMARGTMFKVKSITPATKDHGPVVELEAIGRKENNSVLTPGELAAQLAKDQVLASLNKLSSHYGKK